jgi:hypothetical protein
VPKITRNACPSSRGKPAQHQLEHALEDENAKLKKLLAEQMLDLAAMKDLVSKKW